MADNDTLIHLAGLNKAYSLEPNPSRRLWAQLSGRRGSGPVHHALRNIDLDVRRGETVGIVGRNGAGKSTLLQVLCGVLEPTSGTRRVDGRIAALLELGAGFNTELSGRENVRLNAPLLGIGRAELERRLPDIIEFADIGAFIDQPVRSYSSGMFMRLAFSMATAVDPDILVIDEALSVGDGAFARKSFDRIMALRDRGVTVLFCSHSLFQVEAVCQRAIWLHDGEIRFDGRAAEAVMAYREWEDGVSAGTPALPVSMAAGSRQGSIRRVAYAEREDGAVLRTGVDDLVIDVDFISDPNEMTPTVGVVLHAADGRSVTSAGSWVDGVRLQRDAQGDGRISLRFPRLALLKGRYTVSAYLLCERGVHVYSALEHVLRFEMTQSNLEQGIVSLPRSWHGGAMVGAVAGAGAGGGASTEAMSDAAPGVVA